MNVPCSLAYRADTTVRGVECIDPGVSARRGSDVRSVRRSLVTPPEECAEKKGELMAQSIGATLCDPDYTVRVSTL